MLNFVGYRIKKVSQIRKHIFKNGDQFSKIIHDQRPQGLYKFIGLGGLNSGGLYQL